MKNRLFLFVFLLAAILLQPYTSAQVVYEPVGRDIYPFMEKLAQKGIITFNDQFRPVPRIYIAEKLLEANSKNDQLTSLEKEEAAFYMKDYGLEIEFIKSEKKNSGDNNSKQLFNYLGNDQYGRLRVFSYSDSLFKLNLSPVLGIETGKNAGSNDTHTWNGLGLYGYIGRGIGFSFDFRDNTENGQTIDRTKQFTPVTGVSIAKESANHIEYSESHAILAANWSWGEISAGQDFMEWGYGESGNLVLSTKAPSFPFIRLDIHPTDWLRFNYFHAWLNSGVIDSASGYPTYINSITGYGSRDILRNKFMASHTITVTPLNGLDFSLGESIIYSDKFEFVYLIPINFFRLADHYLSGNDNSAGGNAQFFFGLSSRNHVKNTHLYSTLFIDEITFEGLFNSHEQRNQFGFMFGGSVTDLPIENLTSTLEFTKIYPFVYSHYIPTQLYTNGSYVLGDWMGNNADRIYVSLNYRLIRGLQATVWGQYIRKGESGVAVDQYTQPQPPFLFGLRNYYTYFGFDVKYEITHEFFAEAKFQNLSTRNEIRTGTFNDITANQFLVSLYYGM